MLVESRTREKIFSLAELLERGEIKTGSYFVLYCPNNKEIPFGQFRQLIRDEGEGYIVSAILFNKKTNSIERIEESDGKLLRCVPDRKNVLQVVSEEQMIAMILSPIISRDEGNRMSINLFSKTTIPKRIPPKIVPGLATLLK